MKKKLIYLCLAILTIFVMACDPGNPNSIAKIEPVIAIGVCFTLIVGIIALAIIKEAKRPRWQQVYFWIMKEYSMLTTEEGSVEHITNMHENFCKKLKKKFKLTEQQCESCIVQIGHQQWFEDCEFLKE